MTDAPGINRISLRIPGDLFRKLEDKRHEQRTTFQEIGLRLFQAWLAEGKESFDVRETPEVSQKTQGLESVLDGGVAAVSAENLREILLDFKAQILTAIAEDRRSRAARSGKGKRKKAS